MIRFSCLTARRSSWLASGFALLLCWASGSGAELVTELGWPEAGLTLRLEHGKVTGRDAAGAVVIAPRWESIDPLGDIAEVQQGGRYGVIDKRGRTLVEPAWDAIDYDAVVQRFWVLSGDKFGVLDLDGKVVFSPLFDNHQALSEKDSRHIVAVDGRMGLADIGTGKLLIPIEYERLYAEERTLGRFSTLAAMQGGKWGFITQENRVVVPLEYDGWIGDVDYDTGIAWMRTGESVVQVSVTTPEQRTALNLQGVVGVNLPEADPLSGMTDTSQAEERYLPRDLASESAVVAAVEDRTLRELAYPSILLHGDSASVGFGNFASPDIPVMISRPALCRSDDGFSLLIDSGSPRDCTKKRLPRLRFKRHGTAGLSCLNCNKFGLPGEWLRSDPPRDGRFGYAKCAAPALQETGEMGALYRAWLSRFEAEMEAFFAMAVSRAATKGSDQDVDYLFAKSVVKYSRMNHLLDAVVAGSDKLPPVFRSAHGARARVAILMEALRQAEPVGSGGSYPEQIRIFPPCATVWYVTLAGKATPLPPPGTLVRHSAPFLTLIQDAEGIKLAGLSEEFIRAIGRPVEQESAAPPALTTPR